MGLVSAYILAVILVVITPGPTVLMTISNGMSYGVRHAMVTILGNLTMNIIHITLASLGLGLLLTSAAGFFSVVKWVGASYIIYLGLKQIFSKGTFGEVDVKKEVPSAKALYLQGLMVSGTNPKGIVFFAALFPMFINPESAKLPQILLLTVIFLIINGTCLTLYARFARGIHGYLSQRGKVQWGNRMTGSILVVTGVLLARVKTS